LQPFRVFFLTERVGAAMVKPLIISFLCILGAVGSVRAQSDSLQAVPPDTFAPNVNTNNIPASLTPSLMDSSSALPRQDGNVHQTHRLIQRGNSTQTPESALQLPFDTSDSLRTVFRPWNVNLMLAQMVGGTVGFAAGFLAGGGISALIMQDNNKSGWERAMAAGLLGYVGATLLGIPLGVQLSGEMAHGNGSFVASLTGAAANLLLGILVGAVHEEPSKLEVGLFVAGHLIGPIVGYHLSATPVYQDPVTWPEPVAHGLNRDPLRRASEVQLTFTLVRF
jgi:hypothetical protein